MFGDSARQRTRRRTLLIALLVSTAAFATGPYVSFTRITTPPYGFAPGQRIAVIYAIGDNRDVAVFVDDFVDTVDRAGTLHIDNDVENNQHPLDTDFRALRRRHPADRYVGVSAFTCSGSEHSAEGSEHDAYGERVRRVHRWVDAVCDARLEVRDDRGQHLLTVSVRGQGTSPRSTSLTAEERAVAFEQAARYAAFNAADMMTPRMVKETIELDPSCPAFDEGMAMVESDRLADARAIWEIALRRHRDSAALNYDLGAICEAAGDLKAARKYFETAVRLAPNDPRYRQEMKRAGERRP